MFHIFCMIQNIVNFIVPSNLPLTSATFMEKNFPDWDPVFCPVSGFCTSSGDTNLIIGWIMQYSIRNSKMKFANHFSKIHPLVLPHTMYFRCQIQITVDVNSFEVSWMADSTDMKDDIWLSKKWTQNCLHQQKCESDT